MTESAHSLYGAHLKTILEQARRAFRASKYERLVIHSGSRIPYALDDQHAPFKVFPHFARFVPLGEPEAFIDITSDSVRVIEAIPDDYWEDTSRSTAFWEAHVERVEVKSYSDAWELVAKKDAAFIGDDAAVQEALKQRFSPDSINDEVIIEALNTSRQIKTPYEVDCIRGANELAGVGFISARSAFFEGASEFEIHLAYLKALQKVESELPYPTIVALDEKASVLHYQRKRNIPGGRVFLLDAGASSYGYASDITRTYTKDADPLFMDIVSELATLQESLALRVKPNLEFIELHHEAHLGVARILKKVGLVSCGEDEALELGITRAFFPHGLGHMLGIQVHDVSGKREVLPAHPFANMYPKLRSNVRFEPGMVTTIEPGIYFIPMLLKGLRDDAQASLNARLVEKLMPFGGVRIEDDILVTEEGSENLTRQFVP